MTPFDFGPGIPDVPPPTFDIPTPSIPQADFVSIGTQKKIGEQASGFWEWLLRLILTWIPEAIGAMVGAILGLVELIAAYFIRIFFKAMTAAAFGSDQVMAAVVTGVFGVPIAASAFTNMQDPLGRAGVARQTAAAVITGLSGGVAPGAAGSIDPSSAAAEKFIELVMRMDIDSWGLGALMEFCSVGILKEFGRLGEEVQESLGIGRLSRRILGVPVRTLVVQPFQKLVNKTYHPTGLGESGLVRQFIRGAITRQELDAELDVKGYTAARIDQLINEHKVHVPTSDVLALLGFGAIPQATAEDMLAAQGFDIPSRQQLITLRDEREKHELDFKLAEAALQHYARGELAEADVVRYIQDPGLTQNQKNYLGLLHDFHRNAKHKLLSLAEGVQMVTQGVWTITQFRDLATKHGFSINDVDDLELLLLHKVVDAADAARRRAAAKAARDAAAAAKILHDQQKAARALQDAHVHGVSIARFETLVKDGLKSIGDYQTFLQNKGIAAEDIGAFVAHLQNVLNALAARRVAAGAPVAAAKAKGLSLSELEKGVKGGWLSMGEFQARLAQAGMDAADIGILVDLLNDEIALARAKAAALAAAKAAAQHKHLNLGQEHMAARQGFITVLEYGARLTNAGFDPPDVAILVAEVQAQIAADAIARGRRTGSPPIVGAKGPSLATVERAVRLGVAPRADYAAALVAAGYDATAQADLLGLLDVMMAQDARTAALRGFANGRLSPRGLTLPEIERAVKTHVLPMADYIAALVRAGVDGASAQVLSLVLAASIKTTTAPIAKVKSIAALLAEKGLSLSRLESDVLAERLTLAAFGTMLSGAGVDATALAQLQSTLAMELTARQDAARIAKAARLAAVSKQLNLGQELAAVKVGVQGVPDYATLAAKLGYDPAAVQILVATYEAQHPPAALPPHP